MISKTRMPLNEHYTAQWYEYTPQSTLAGEDGEWTDIPADFRYKQYIDDQGVRYPMPGMRTTDAGLEISIETSSDFNFKEHDKVKFANGSILRIKSKSYNRQVSNSMAAFQFPGAVDDYKTTVISFHN